MSSGPASEEPRVDRHRPDWYPDPTRRFEFRYHNGRDWTGDVAVDGARFLDPLPRLAPGAGAADGSWPVAPAQTSAASASLGGGGGPTGGSSGGGKATAALVLGIGSVVTGWVPFVFVLSAVAAVLALVFGISTLRRLRRQQTVDTRARNFARTGVILAPVGLCLCVLGTYLTVAAYREVDRFTDVGDHELGTTTCEVDSGVATMTGSIVNRSTTTRDYHLTIEFLRPQTDNVLYNTSVDVDDVGPDESARWSVHEVVRHDELECRVDQVTGPLPFGQS